MVEAGFRGSSAICGRLLFTGGFVGRQLNNTRCPANCEKGPTSCDNADTARVSIPANEIGRSLSLSRPQGRSGAWPYRCQP